VYSEATMQKCPESEPIEVAVEEFKAEITRFERAMKLCQENAFAGLQVEIRERLAEVAKILMLAGCLTDDDRRAELAELLERVQGVLQL
jgi:hypothetical protein